MPCPALDPLCWTGVLVASPLVTWVLLRWANALVYPALSVRQAAIPGMIAGTIWNIGKQSIPLIIAPCIWSPGDVWELGAAKQLTVMFPLPVAVCDCLRPAVERQRGQHYCG